MTKVINYSGDVLGWQRNPGPPRVWRVVDGRKKTADGKNLRFSIQEVPEDRYDDVLNHMCTTFARDEPISNHTKAINNPGAMEDFRKLWSFALRQGVVMGAFLVDEDNPKPVLAGANMTLIYCEATEKGFKTGIEFTAETTRKILGFMDQLDKEKSTRKIYKVDKYITAFGLSVDPQYRGQGLGVQLLDARTEMAAAYDIKATSTVFTALAAQRSAEQAGFELLIERNYVDLKNEDGTELFPGIPQKSVKLMGKTLS